jgi:hypothetical protein
MQPIFLRHATKGLVRDHQTQWCRLPRGSEQVDDESLESEIIFEDKSFSVANL